MTESLNDDKIDSVQDRLLSLIRKLNEVNDPNQRAGLVALCIEALVKETCPPNFESPERADYIG